jgi:nucleoside-diphosphate-sugar epimerase
MNFTVLGGQGVIGRALVARLRQGGHAVAVPDRADRGDPRRPWGHVIYAIGLTADFRRRPFETVEAHVGVLGEVLRQALFDSFLYLSSTRVYAGAASTAEDTPLSVRPADPSDLYNLSKLLGESLCLNDPRATVRVARLSNVVGGEDADSDNFVPTLRREARSGCIRLHSALDSAKDYLHIDDAVRLLEDVALRGTHRLYNVASGRSISHRAWVERLQAATGCAVELAPQAPRLCFADIDIRRLIESFGPARIDPLSIIPLVPARTIP